MRSLKAVADALGVRIYQSALPGDLLGYYDLQKHIIVVKAGLHLHQRRSTLAHELGHAFYAHECSNERNERQARKKAAELLVSPAAYAAAEKLSQHTRIIAEELGVTSEIVEDYREFWLDSTDRASAKWSPSMASALVASADDTWV